jgi:hypothetical protein
MPFPPGRREIERHRQRERLREGLEDARRGPLSGETLD